MAVRVDIKAKIVESGHAFSDTGSWRLGRLRGRRAHRACRPEREVEVVVDYARALS